MQNMDMPVAILSLCLVQGLLVSANETEQPTGVKTRPSVSCGNLPAQATECQEVIVALTL